MTYLHFALAETWFVIYSVLLGANGTCVFIQCKIQADCWIKILSIVNLRVTDQLARHVIFFLSEIKQTPFLELLNWDTDEEKTNKQGFSLANMAELVSVLATFRHNRFDDFWQPHNLIFSEPLWQHWGQTEFHSPNSCCAPASCLFPEMLPIWAIGNVLRDHLLLLLFNQLLVPLLFLSIVYLFTTTGHLHCSRLVWETQPRNNILVLTAPLFGSRNYTGVK